MIGNFCLERRPKIIFGKNSVDFLSGEVEKYNKILLIYGMGSVKKNGSLEKVCKNLESKKVIEFGGVEANPRLTKVREGIEICKKENIDLILALGGGSVMDCAKAISLGAKSDFDIWDIIVNKKEVTASIDLGLIPTMIATGSETNDIFVVLNDEEKLKRSLKSKFTYPKFTIMDPTYTLTINKRHTVAGIVDTLSHLLEQYVNDKNNKIVNDLIVTYFKRILDISKDLVDDLNNYELREEHMYIAMSGYNGDYKTIVGGDFGCHGLDYGLASEFDNIHGEGLSILTCKWLKYVTETGLENAHIINNFFKDLYGEDDCEKGIAMFESHLKILGAPLNYEDIGIEIDEKTLANMIKKAQFTKPLGATIPLTEENIRGIYLK